MRHVTYRGKVVYKRPKHFFSEADVQRILRRLQKSQPRGNLLSWINDILIDIQKGMLRQALATVGLDELTDMIYQYMRELIYQFLTLGWLSRPGIEALINEMEKKGYFERGMREFSQLGQL